MSNMMFTKDYFGLQQLARAILGTFQSSFEINLNLCKMI